MQRTLAVLLALVSFSAQGELRWEYSTEGMIAGNPIVHQDRVYITAGTRLHVVNTKGELEWAYDTGARTQSSVAVSDQAIFVVADNGLHAVDGNGDRLWLFETRDGPFEVEGTTMGWGEGEHPDTGTTHTRPAHHEGIVVVGSWDNHLYGLNIDDGTEAWKVVARLPVGEMAGWLGWEGFNLDPVIHDGVAYAGSRGTHFYAIDVKTGNEKWSWKHPSSWVGSPAGRRQPYLPGQPVRRAV